MYEIKVILNGKQKMPPTVPDLRFKSIQIQLTMKMFFKFSKAP